MNEEEISRPRQIHYATFLPKRKRHTSSLLVVLRGFEEHTDSVDHKTLARSPLGAAIKTFAAEAENKSLVGK